MRRRVPADLSVEGPGWDRSPTIMLPATLKPAEKRALDLISDWPWITLDGPGRNVGRLGPQRTSQLVIPSRRVPPRRPGPSPGAGGRLALTDRALALLARRDRTSVAVARRSGGAPLPEDSPAPHSSGDNRDRQRGARQLLRNIEHTAAVHAFLAAHDRAGAPSWIGRSPRSTRPAGHPGYFKHGDGMRSVNPDAFGIPQQRATTTWPFLLEWERRGPCGPRPCRSASPPICATSPLTGPPTTTAPGPPSSSSSTSEIVQTHFLRLARDEMQAKGSGQRAPVGLPQGRHRAALGPLGRAWRAPGRLASRLQAMPPQ